MRDFYKSLPAAELRRVSSLEMFDEYEEWHLKCYHYMVVIARSDNSSFPGLEKIVNNIKDTTRGMNEKSLPMSF